MLFAWGVVAIALLKRAPTWANGTPRVLPWILLFAALGIVEAVLHVLYALLRLFF
jgi:hypothetical protein